MLSFTSIFFDDGPYIGIGSALFDVLVITPAFLSGLAFSLCFWRLARRIAGYDHTQRWLWPGLAAFVVGLTVLSGYWYSDLPLLAGRLSLADSFGTDPIGLTANAILIFIGGFLTALLIGLARAVRYIRRHDLPVYTFRQLKIGDEFHFLHQYPARTVLIKSDKKYYVLEKGFPASHPVHISDLDIKVIRHTGDSCNQDT